MRKNCKYTKKNNRWDERDKKKQETKTKKEALTLTDKGLGDDLKENRQTKLEELDESQTEEERS